ncbi:hypothetical protein J1614_006797 [Plenodomus biglobosus]|nr:hypothetical protein J1614_006797 [Plenodomus biglobosus]
MTPSATCRREFIRRQAGNAIRESSFLRSDTATDATPHLPRLSHATPVSLPSPPPGTSWYSGFREVIRSVRIIAI